MGIAEETRDIAPDPLEQQRPLHEYMARREGEYIETARKFLRIPGFSDTGEGIRESAAAALELVKRVAPDTARLVETPGNPVVFGKSLSRHPNANTLLVYCLYDQTPVIQDEWDSDPLGAHIVNATQIGLPEEMGSVICARAAYNHRGPMTALILAVEAMRRVEGDIPANIVWVWDGEEEIGSPNLHVFMEQYESEISACDALYMPYFQQAPNGGSMLIWRGKKGALLFELECKGGEWGGTLDGRHTWAGHQPWVDAPMMRLLQAVASLYDADHNVAIDGLPELVVPLSPEDRADIEVLKQAWSDDAERLLKAQIGIGRFRNGSAPMDLLERVISSVVLNVEGVVGGYMGPTYYSMLPQKAVAKFDVRLPAGPTTEKSLALLRAHLDRRGFPEIEIKNARGYEGHRTPGDEPVIQAAIRAAALHGVETTLTPSSNSFCPVSSFAKPPFDLPSVSTGLGHGERPHQPNEYMSVDAVRDYMKFAVTYLHEWART